MTHSDFRRYLLSNVLRSPDDPAAAAAAPATAAGAAAAAPSATAPDAAAAAGGAASASPAVDGAAAPAAEAPAAADGTAAPDTKPESTPSLLEAAQAKLPAKEGDTPADAKAAPKDGATTDKPAADAKPATDAKPTDAKKPAEKPAGDKAAKDGKSAPATEALAENQPQARSYEAFTVPEGVKITDKDVKEFTGVLDNPELSHQDRAQKLVDIFAREAQRFALEQVNHQRKVWTDYTDQLKADLKADKELGGDQVDTSLGIAKFVCEKFGGSEDQISDLMKHLTHTGMGNYVGLTRLLNNIYERAIAPRIVPGNPPSRGGNARSRQDAFYGDPGGSGAAS